MKKIKKEVNIKIQSDVEVVWAVNQSIVIHYRYLYNLENQV